MRTRAERAIRKRDIIALSARDSQRVMDALLSPQPAHLRLRDAAERYNEFMVEAPSEPPAAQSQVKQLP